MASPLRLRELKHLRDDAVLPLDDLRQRIVELNRELEPSVLDALANSAQHAQHLTTLPRLLGDVVQCIRDTAARAGEVHDAAELVNVAEAMHGGIREAAVLVRQGKDNLKLQKKSLAQLRDRVHTSAGARATASRAGFLARRGPQLVDGVAEAAQRLSGNLNSDILGFLLPTCVGLVLSLASTVFGGRGAGAQQVTDTVLRLDGALSQCRHHHQMFKRLDSFLARLEELSAVRRGDGPPHELIRDLRQIIDQTEQFARAALLREKHARPGDGGELGLATAALAAERGKLGLGLASQERRFLDADDPYCHSPASYNTVDHLGFTGMRGLHRALDEGYGAGYDAALMRHRLGDDLDVASNMSSPAGGMYAPRSPSPLPLSLAGGVSSYATHDAAGADALVGYGDRYRPLPMTAATVRSDMTLRTHDHGIRYDERYLPDALVRASVNDTLGPPSGPPALHLGGGVYSSSAPTPPLDYDVGSDASSPPSGRSFGRQLERRDSEPFSVPPLPSSRRFSIAGARGGFNAHAGYDMAALSGALPPSRGKAPDSVAYEPDPLTLRGGLSPTDGGFLRLGHDDEHQRAYGTGSTFSF